MRSKNTILGLLGLLLIAIGLVTWGIMMKMNTYAVIAMAGGLLLVLAYVFMNIQYLSQKLTGRTAVEGFNMAVSLAVFLIIVVFAEILLVRHSTRFDFTQVKKYSLANQSIQLARDLKSPITFMFLENPNDPQSTERAKELMELYAHYSDQIKVEVVDPQRDPQRVEQLAPVTLGAIYVQKDEQHEKVAPVDENNLTNALLKLTQGSQKIVYFTTGHNEPSIEGTDTENREKIVGICDMLKEEGYQVKSLPLATMESIPEDAAAVMVVNPVIPFLQTEIDTLFNYIDKAGKVLFFLDPETNSGLEAPIEEKLGILLGNDWVLENNPAMRLFGGQPTAPLMAGVGNHPIVDAFGGRISALPFPFVRSVQVSEVLPTGVEATELIKTGAESWAESNLTALKTTRRAEYNEGEDQQGPITIAVALTKQVDAADAAVEDSTPEETGDENVEK
ncbi:MAG: GldG family protein, partial [bacterium]|nr:GldG family protein [bacterium]